MSASTAAEVIVVGAGPVGLALAIELGRRGVRTLVIEQHERIGRQPRAKTTNVRSMEHMRRWGIAERVRAASPLPGDHPTDIVFATRLFGHRLAKIENAFYGSRVRNDWYSEPAQWIPQYAVESVLRDRAGSLGAVELRFVTRLDRLREIETGVVAEVTDLKLGRSRELTAAYLVGADGARSAVRSLLGIPMQGEHAYAQNLNLVLRIGGLGVINPQPPAIMNWLVNADAPGVIGPMDRDDTWYFMMAAPADDVLPTPALALRRVASALGRDLAMEMLTFDPWAAHSLIASRYGRGRIFLAGDACHLHPPYGGYGMNMGISDAVDLGWKLAARLRGWGGARLLASYERERRPVHRRVIEEAVENYAAIPQNLVRPDLESEGREGEVARERLAAEILASKPREFNTLGVVLGYHYSGSPIVLSDGSAPPEPHFMQYRPSAHPGCLAPHLWLADATSLYDGFADDFTLLVTGAGAEDDVARLRAAAAARGLPLAVFAPADDRLRDLYEARLALIRPDQHVAWRGDRLDRDPGALFDRVRGA